MDVDELCRHVRFQVPGDKMHVASPIAFASGSSPLLLKVGWRLFGPSWSDKLLVGLAFPLAHGQKLIKDRDRERRWIANSASHCLNYDSCCFAFLGATPYVSSL